MQSIEEHITIEEILTESNSVNLRKEVVKSAQEILNTGRNRGPLTTLEAYHMAYKKHTE